MKVPCPDCDGQMKKGSIQCRECSKRRLKKEFNGYFVKDPAIVPTAFIPYRRPKRWR